MTRLGQQVAAVQLRIRRRLLDDEHLDPQLQQLVERRGVEILGPGATQRNAHQLHTARADTIPRLSRRRRPRPAHLAAVKVADVTAWEPDVLPGYWQQTLPLGPDPDGEGELVATLVRRGEAGRPARHAVLAAARVHRLLLQHRAGRPLRRPRLRLLRAGPAQVRAVAARGPDAALHHRPGALRRRTGARARRSSPRDTGGRRRSACTATRRAG